MTIDFNQHCFFGGRSGLKNKMNFAFFKQQSRPYGRKVGFVYAARISLLSLLGPQSSFTSKKL